MATFDREFLLQTQGVRLKRIAMRSDKTDESFEAMIYACSAIINSR